MTTLKERSITRARVFCLRFIMLCSVGLLYGVAHRPAAATIFTVSPGEAFIGHTDVTLPNPANANANSRAVSPIGAVTLDGALFAFAPFGTGSIVVTDFFGQLLHITDSLGRSVNLGPSTEPLRTISDSAGNVTRFTYDGLDRLARIEAPSGDTTRYQYDSSDRLVRTVDPAGTTTEYQYDPGNNRLQMITEPGPNVTQYEYDSSDRLIRNTDPAGMMTEYQYDGLNRMIRRTEPGPNVTEYTYDASGNLSQTTNPAGMMTEYQYDGLNRLIRRIEPGPNVTEYMYDASGNLSQTTDPAGMITEYQYDGVNRLTRLVAPDRVTEYTYDSMGQLRSIDDSQLGTARFSPIPEPSTFVLAAMVAAWGVAWRRVRIPIGHASR